MAYSTENQGALFRNKHKTEGDRRPEYEGSLNIDGKDYRLAAWVREAKNGGGTFFSIKVEPAKPKTEPAAETTEEPAF